MKTFFLSLIAVFLSINNSLSQDFYYYHGKKIELKQRSDRLVVVLNSNQFNKDYISQNILAAGINEEVKEIDKNIYLINFKENSVNERNLYQSSIPKNDLIKFISPVYYGESQKVIQVVGDEFVVKLKNVNDKEKLDIFNIQNNVSIIGKVDNENGFLLKSNYGSQKNALELSSIYYNSGFFEYAEPNFIYPELSLLDFTPNDIHYPDQWALNNTGQTVPTGNNTDGDSPTVNGISNADMDVNLAWNYTSGSPLIKIAIVDTGIDSTHPDFNSSGIPHLLPGYDAYNNINGVRVDSFGHGTCTAGIIGALMHNGIGTAGVASGCMLMSIKIFNSSGTTSSLAIARAFDTARVRDIDIINNSYNGGTPSQVISDAINSAYLNGKGGKGCLIFFAAGNDGRSEPWFPSYLPEVICVGGSTPHDQIKSPGTGNQFFWGSNYGETSNGDLDIIAPTICYTTDLQGGLGYNHQPRPDGDSFGSFSGTSASSPNAAGVAALILSINPNFSRLEVLNKLYRGCDKIENVPYSVNKQFGKWNEYSGYGRVNAYNSVQLALGVDVVPPTIVHKNISSRSSTYPTLITAEIIDQNGDAVPDSGLQQPKLFYQLKKFNNGWSGFDSITASSVIGNNFTFAIPCLGYETQVKYYIRAEDNLGNEAFFPRGVPAPFWLCYFAVGDIISSLYKIGGFTAADYGVTYSPPVNIDSFVIVDTKVQLYLTHPHIGEEIIELFSPGIDPNNNRKCLFASNGGSGSDIYGATVSDSAVSFWNSGMPPYMDGYFKSDYMLNGFNGTNAYGNWTVLNFDQVSGSFAIFDSVILTFFRTSGMPSPSIKADTPSDSILDFGNVIYGDTLVKDFYLKNSGNENLNISSISFTGEFAQRFSIADSFPSSIFPNDSGLIKVKLTTTNLTGNTSFISALMHIQNNDPSKSDFNVSLITDSNLTTYKILNLKTYIQGFYNPSIDSMITGDTMTVYLRDSSSPFDIIDSATSFTKANGQARFRFINILNNSDYFIQLHHRSSIDIWSYGTNSFSSDTLNYDFTLSDTLTFGNNAVQLDSAGLRFGAFNGDVDGNGLIDVSDLVTVFNDVSLSSTGYLNTDLTGDEVVDVNDLLLAFNNTLMFVETINP